jgi:hypothetical protein
MKKKQTDLFDLIKLKVSSPAGSLSDRPLISFSQSIVVVCGLVVTSLFLHFFLAGQAPLVISNDRWNLICDYSLKNALFERFIALLLRGHKDFR